MVPRPRWCAVPLAASLILGACVISPTRTPPPQGAQTVLPRGTPLGPSTAEHLSELEPLSSAAGNGPVVGLHFSSDTQVLQAVYGGSGALVRWDMHSRSIISEHLLGISTGNSLRFDTLGALLLGATTSDERSPADLGADMYLSGVEVWDTQSGESLYCVVRPCEETDGTTVQYPSLSIGADMNTRGTWALDYSSTAISFDDLRGNGRERTLLLEDPDHSLRIANVALDATGARYAIAFRQGSFTVRHNWSGALSSLLAIGLSTGVGENVAVPDMSFSSGGKYLAAIMEEDLLVWELGPLSGSKVMTESVPGAFLVLFNPTDELVAVAASDSILVFDLGERSLAASLSAPGLTSMAFDSANYLLLWGDRQGVVHLLQVEAGPG